MEAAFYTDPVYCSEPDLTLGIYHMKSRTYLTSQTGNRYYLTLAKVAYDRELFERAYKDLRQGIEPSRAIIKQAQAIGSALLRNQGLPWFLSSDGQHKMEASNRASKGLWKSFVMHLAPSNSSGFQVCPSASLGCIKSCLNKAGHGVIVNVQAGRIKRTKLYFEHREIFCLLLWHMLSALNRRKYRVAIRLNGTSDIVWESKEPWIFQLFPKIQFYDYSKIPARFNRKMPANYALTFSRSETNHIQAMEILNRGFNVAVVFSYPIYKSFTELGSFCGSPVVDGAADDRRWLDPKGSLVALKALGPAKRDTSGFVLRQSLGIIN